MAFGTDPPKLLIFRSKFIKNLAALQLERRWFFEGKEAAEAMYYSIEVSRHMYF